MRPEVAARVRLPSDVAVSMPPAPMTQMPGRLLWEHTGLPRSLRAFRPEAVFGPFNVVPTAWPRPRPRIAVMVSNLAPYSRTVLSLCRPPERLRNEVLRRLTDRTIARADLVFIQSKQAFELIGADVLDGKAEVVSHAPPPVPAPDRVSASVPDEPYFVVVGDLYKFKGVELVIQALSILDRAERPLVVVCGRPLERDYVRSVTEEARRLGVGDRLHLAGPVDHEDLLVLLRSAQGCIAPSRFENLSRVPGEAMSVGTPVIASDIASFREASGDAALYFPLDRPAELARHMRSVMRDAGLRAELGAKGEARVSSLDTGKSSAQILTALEKLAS
jgi:glycosyltransferase involved in cell wall biosynthesis